MVGQSIAHYKILEKLGEGGMGVVYKAEDTKLDRTVALKFLPEKVAGGSPELERFTLEAKAAAGLSHPNICTIYGLEESDGRHFIVMEFVDGQTLQEKKSSLSLKQALDVGIQVAEGLAAAHEKGIVHRDIKPENIMIRKDGRVQIMDFGLAKLRTIAGMSRLTQAGSTVGTVGYMSPEQVQGTETDHRSDIFSLGVLLYEMFTGQPPFKGVHETAVAYEVVNVDSPPMSTLKPELSPELDAIVMECLEKEPNERTQSAKQIAIDLNRFKRTSSRSHLSRVMQAQTAATPGAASASRSRPLGVIMLLIVVAALVGVGAGWFLFRSTTTNAGGVVRFTVPFQGEDSSKENGYRNFAISPDGSRIIYSSIRDGRIYIREMNSTKAAAVQGIDIVNGSSADNIAFSPDGRWFLYSSQGKMYKESVSGGPPIAICDAGNEWWGSWSPSGEIIFVRYWGSNLFIVPAEAGATPRPLTTLKTEGGERGHVAPQALPDGKHVLFTIWTGASFEESEIAIADLATGEHRILLKGGADARYAENGYLIFSRGTTLMAVPFDLSTLQTKGEPVPMIAGVSSNGGDGKLNFVVSANGTAVYLNGEVEFSPSSIKILDLQTQKLQTLTEASNFGGVLYAPDGKRFCVNVYGPTYQVALFDPTVGILTPLTFSSDNWRFCWVKDGSRITFSSNLSGTYQIYSIAAQGGSAPEPLFQQSGNPAPSSWSRDGSTLAYVVAGDSTGSDIWLYTPSASPKNHPLLNSPANESEPRISPDARWMAYVSDAEGGREVYLRPFPGGGGKWRISNGGGAEPVWSPDEKRIYYRANDDIYAVRIALGSGSVEVGRPELVYAASGLSDYDISPDGGSLALTQRVIKKEQKQLNVVLNWFDELKTKVPVN